MNAVTAPNPSEADSLAALHWQSLSFDALEPRRLHALMQLRQRVFVVEQACTYLDLDGADPRCLHVFALDAEGEPVAYARIVPPGIKFAETAIGRVVVAAPWRRRGIGRALMERAIAAARAAHPRSAIRIAAQARLAAYYASIGFVAAGPVYDDAGIPHVDMVLAEPAP